MDSFSSVVHVWYACVGWLADLTLRQRCLAMLDEREQEAHARFRVEHARESYLLAHALCRAALSHHAASANAARQAWGGIAPSAWRFAPTARGKPGIVAPAGAPGLHFNISHSRIVVAVAVSPDCPVGVDVEDAARNVDVAKLGTQVLTPREYAACTAHGAGQVHFLRHWTLKEAYLKALGEGISEQLTLIDMHVDEAVPDAPIPVTDARRKTLSEDWHLRLLHMRVCGTECVLAAAAGASPQASRFVWSDAAGLLMV